MPQNSLISSGRLLCPTAACHRPAAAPSGRCRAVACESGRSAPTATSAGPTTAAQTMSGTAADCSTVQPTPRAAQLHTTRKVSRRADCQCRAPVHGQAGERWSPSTPSGAGSVQPRHKECPRAQLHNALLLGAPSGRRKAWDSTARVLLGVTRCRHKQGKAKSLPQLTTKSTYARAAGGTGYLPVSSASSFRDWTTTSLNGSNV